MRIVYNKTSNIIDLAEVRRRQDPARRDSLARQAREGSRLPGEASDFYPVVPDTREEGRRARRERSAWCLDIGASLAVILMTAVFALRILI